jgi:formyltetrahydrofolate deformylase
MPDYILTLQCNDKMGIVAKISGYLFDHQCNITEASQFTDQLNQYFFAHIRFHFAGDVKNLRQNFQALAATYDMKWQIHDIQERVKTIIMVSKEAHCLTDLLYKHRTSHLPIDVTAIVSNHEDHRKYAEDLGYRFEYLPVTADTKLTQEKKLRDMIETTQTELIVLARYMQVLSEDFCAWYPARIINIHHSFLPGFKGAKPYHQAFHRGVKLIGATAHFVTQDLDEGPIIEQETLRINHTYTPDMMRIAGKDIEAAVLSRAVQKYAQHRVFLQDHHTIVF